MAVESPEDRNSMARRYDPPRDQDRGMSRGQRRAERRESCRINYRRCRFTRQLAARGSLQEFQSRLVDGMPAQVAKTSNRGRADKGDQLQRRPLTAPYIPVITINIDGAPVARQVAYAHRALFLLAPAWIDLRSASILRLRLCRRKCANHVA